MFFSVKMDYIPAYIPVTETPKQVRESVEEKLLLLFSPEPEGPHRVHRITAHCSLPPPPPPPPVWVPSQSTGRNVQSVCWQRTCWCCGQRRPPEVEVVSAQSCCKKIHILSLDSSPKCCRLDSRSGLSLSLSLSLTQHA